MVENRPSIIMPNTVKNPYDGPERRQDPYSDRLASIESKIDSCSERIHRNEFKEAVEKLQASIRIAVNNGDERLKSLEDWRESNDKTVSSHSEDILALKEALSRSESRDIQLQDSINAMHVTLNQFANSTPSSVKQAIKSPVIWTAAGVIASSIWVVGVLYYIATGDPTILESAK